MFDENPNPHKQDEGTPSSTPTSEEGANGWHSDAPTWAPPPPNPPSEPSHSSAPNTYTWTPTPPTPPTSFTPPPPKKRRSGSGILIAVLAIVCAVSLGVSMLLIVDRATKPNNEGGNPNSSVSEGATGNQSPDDSRDDAPPLVTADPEEEGLTSREIVNANLHSTVVITMYTNAGNSFFAQTTVEESVAGQATGIVWTADGYIITNAHCVYSEDLRQLYSRIEVELYDGTTFERAEVVGYDTTTDLAVIKVDATNLTPATFGDSDALQMGDRVLALGNNSGLGWTVTGGMISGLARDVYEETNYAIKCLQVDAVINPGNSGGPLLNASGQVIGINSAKIVAEGYEGLGFSIPINEAREILQDLVEHGYVKGRIMLGIEGYTFDRYSGYEGFYISAIGKNSCFVGTAAAVGDIITHVNGERVKSYAEMREELTSHQVGEQVTITLLRISRNSAGVQKFDITITLMESDGTV